MGFLSRKKDDVEDSNRSALFGGRKKKDGTVAQNPYAAPPANDPYAQPPPAYSNGSSNGSYRQEKTPAVTGPNGSYGQRPGGYSAQNASNSYSNGHSNGHSNGYSNGYSNGHSDDRYGAAPGPAQRPGGYGGLGRTTSQDTMTTDAGRDALFGNAAQRQQTSKPQQSSTYSNGGDGGQPDYYPDGPGRYQPTSYADRRLTAEEEEEEDVNLKKDEIKFIKQQDVSSTRNALRLAQQAEETGRDTLSKLAYQGDRLHTTEANLDRASRQNREAEEKARELKTLNKSMFAMHVSNPFTKNSRNAARDAEIMEKHHNDRDVRDATRKAAWESSARNEGFNRSLQNTGGPSKKSTLADRAKFQFEADSDDDAMENEIDANLDALHGAAKRLNLLGRAMGTEVDEQNKHIMTITGKTDKVDDQIAMNRARLERIK